MSRSGRVPSVVLLLVVSWASTATGQGWAESAVETRAFLDRSGRGDLSRLETSLVLRARYRHGWDKRSQRISVEAFGRIGLDNDRRTHLDFRELNWEKRWSNFELRAGVGTVSWGVIESASIVDLINQRDLLEGLDKRAKLGQPMVRLSWIERWGVVEIFMLPWFRERVFKGRDALLRAGVPVAGDTAVFGSGAGPRHLDWAVHWTHAVGPFDFGVVLFSGTKRDPRFIEARDDNAQTVFIPKYDRVRQVGTHAQWTTSRWLWKLETMTRTGQTTVGGGVEYVPVGFLSVFVEYLYDSRGSEATTLFEDDFFLGARLHWLDGDAGVGTYIDRASGNMLFTAEGTRRFGDRWTVTLAGHLYGGSTAADPPYSPRWDNRVSLTVRRFF